MEDRVGGLPHQFFSLQEGRGEGQSFSHSEEKGAHKVPPPYLLSMYLVTRGAANGFEPPDFHFVTPPPPTPFLH